MARSIVWFRRDLRLTDHHALSEACWSGEVLPVFVIDPAFAHVGAARQTFLLAALGGLQQSIRDLGGELVIRHGDPRREIPALAAEVDAEHVFVTRDAAPLGRARDGTVGERLLAGGRHLIELDSPYVVRPGAIVKPDSAPYSVFTAYHKQWALHVATETVDAPTEVAWISAPSDGLTAAFDRRSADVVAVTESERSAWRQWDAFSAGPSGLADYHRDRDFPALDGTSRMSAYLKFGMVHPRQLLAELDPSQSGQAAFERELAWRDFYGDVLYHRPDAAWNNLRRKFDAITVDSGPRAVAKFERWCTGTTGFPIVDAGMRQLVETGWMHNRVRMIVASFLVKDLHLSWTWGARFFAHHLIDGDVASNSQGWQWAAGSGTDAAPYFRIFNPTTQLDRWDPTGAYVSKWVPELGTTSYPTPMVDHAAEREEALARFAAISGVADRTAEPASAAESPAGGASALSSKQP